jgi:hypothetical protein
MPRMGRRANDRARERHSAVRRRAWFAYGDPEGAGPERLEARDGGGTQDGCAYCMTSRPLVRADLAEDAGVDPYLVQETGPLKPR